MAKPKKDAAATKVGKSKREPLDESLLTWESAPASDAKLDKPKKPKKSKTDKNADKPAKQSKPAKGDKAAKPEKAAKAEKPSKSDKSAENDKPAKHKKPSKSKEATVADSASVERAASAEGFGRLVPVISQLVTLVDLHEPAVRRSVFDTYVSAIVIGGAAIDDLDVLDVRAGRPDEVDEDAVDTVSETDTDSATASTAVADADASADADTKTDAGPDAAGTSDDDDEAGDAAALAGAGIGDADDVLPADDPRPHRRQPAFESEVIAARGSTAASELPTHRTLRGLANQAPPSNNDQRNVVITTWLITRGHEVTPRAVAAGYERMSWRVPVNIGSSLRQTIRKGLLAVGDDDTIFVTRAGAAHFG